MSTEQDERILRLAQDLTDGNPVDWDRMRESYGELLDPLTNLQTLEKISAVFQTTQADPLAGPLVETLESDPRDFWERTTKDPEESPPPPEKWGHLIITEKIGAGAFAIVYRARDPFLKIDVALKLFRPEKTRNGGFADRYLREARKLARVNHENVLVIHGADRREGRVGLWTELIEGITLEKMIEKDGPLGPDVASTYGMKLCKAVAAVHASKLVHRDIKTSNVMKENGGRIVLMDFNTARERETLEDFSVDPGSGTPLFMAPELFRGENSGIRADIYSMGVVLYRLVTKRFPVEAKTLKELKEKHAIGRKNSLLDIRPDLRQSFTRIIEKALAPDPKDRYKTAGELKNALAEYLGIVSDEPEPEPITIPKWVKRTVAALVAAAGIAAVSLWLFFGPFKADATLYRVDATAREPLISGNQVSIGEKLYLEFEGSRKLNVYVLYKNADGQFFRLFPGGFNGNGNPLKADQTHFLPGEKNGNARYWPVSAPAGMESIHVIASLRPWNERVLDTLPIPGDKVSPQRRVRGIGPEVEGPDYARAGVVEELLEKARNQLGVETWNIEFETTESDGGQE